MKWLRWRESNKSRERELDEEIEADFALEIQQRLEAGGATREEAEFAARRDFGNVTRVKEVTRSMWRYNQLETLAQDLTYAIRGMRRTPGFTVIAVLILALGIGANTVIFRMVDAALLRPLPFPESDRLVRVWSTENGTPVRAAGGPSALDMRDFAANAPSFEGLIVYDQWPKNVSGTLGSDRAEEMMVGLVPRAYFGLLRMHPILGRLFSEAEQVYGRHYVVIISRQFWQTRFGGDPRILGKTIRINGETYSIVGVVPDVVPGWMSQTTAPIHIWTPFTFETVLSERWRGFRGYFSLGRLKPGVSLQKARTELATLAARLAQEYPVDRGIGVAIEPLVDTRAGTTRPMLLMLSGAVGFVLVIACANLASLLLARNSARSRELAIRTALGAQRSRLVQQVFIEALVLSLAGSLAGLGLASAAGAALMRMNDSGILPYTTTTNMLGQFSLAVPDGRVLLFAIGISLITSILFGLAPAFTATRFSLESTLREGGRSGAVGLSRQRFRRVLVIAEITLSLVLVFGAGLLTQTMARLLRQNPGFRSDHLLLAHVYIPQARYPNSEAITRFCDSFGQRVRALPGVLDASITTENPPVIGWQQMFTVPGRPISRAMDVPWTRFAAVDMHYLSTMGIPLVSGRDFAETDTSTSEPVAIVNQAFARQFFANQNPIGRQIHPGPPPGVARVPLHDFGSLSRDIAIIGVVRDFMNRGMAQTPAPQILTLFRQMPGLNAGFKDIVVQTATDPESIVPAVARELKSLDADVALGETRSMETDMSNQTADTRLITVLLGLFAGLGTVLAVIGAYGVVAYLVAQRTQEIGVRLALGASTTDILWLILRNGLFLGVAGVALGVGGAIPVRIFLARFLFGISPSDPATLLGAAILLLAVIVLASAIPARRAIRIDPARALRSE